VLHDLSFTERNRHCVNRNTDHEKKEVIDEYILFSYSSYPARSGPNSPEARLQVDDH
jgi:hypothetical protein